VQIAWILWVRVLKCLALVAQVHCSDNTGRFRESDHTIWNRRFYNTALRNRSRVHICISKSNYRKLSCLGENNTQGTSTPWVKSKVTTEFAYKGTSRELHKGTLLPHGHYKRIEMHIKDAIATNQNVTLWANWRYRGSRYKRIQLYRTDLHEVSGPIWIKLKS